MSEGTSRWEGWLVATQVSDQRGQGAAHVGSPLTGTGGRFPGELVPGV